MKGYFNPDGLRMLDALDGVAILNRCAISSPTCSCGACSSMVPQVRFGRLVKSAPNDERAY